MISCHRLKYTASTESKRGGNGCSAAKLKNKFSKLAYHDISCDFAGGPREYFFPKKSKFSCSAIILAALLIQSNSK